MKKILLTLHIILFLSLSAQEKLTKMQWQEDLRFLQNTIHQDYTHLFVKTTKEKFDAEVERLYQEIPNLEEHQIIVGMAKIIALFKYGHTRLSLGQKPFEFYQLPFNLYQFNDGIYIQGAHNEYEQALGAKVLEINKIPIETALERIAPVVESENDQYFKAYGINYLRIPEVLHTQGITDKLETSVTLTLSKNGKTYTQSFNSLPKEESVPTKYSYVFQDKNWLEARDQEATPLYLKHLDKIYYYEYLPEEKAVYVRHSQIYDDPKESISSFYKRVFDFIERNAVEKLILDVRLNGGGNNFLNKPIITGIIETKKINKIGSLFVLIGRRTFSACQNLVNELDTYTNVIFVGEPTAENVNFWGDARTVALPNSKVTMYLSYAWWQDKPAWQNADWIAPSVPVDMSFKEYSTNQDPVLDGALNFSGDDFKADPMQYIVETYSAGNMQELIQELPKMIKDPRYNFFDFERELNKSGYHLMHSGRAEEIHAAIGIFSFITQLFPDSAMTYKNMAEGYLKLKDNDKAGELLKKVLSLDPDGEIGKSATLMLRDIKK